MSKRHSPPEKHCEGIPYLARGFPLCLADSPSERNSDNVLDQLAGVSEIGQNKFCEQLNTYTKQISIFSLYSDFSLYSLRLLLARRIADFVDGLLP